MKYDLVLFDLDGTLCDPGPGITDSVAYALTKMGITEADHDKLRQFVGPPLLNSFKELYLMSDEESQKAVKIYREKFQETGIHEYIVYPGIIKLLDNLRQKGTQMGVATSKIERFAKQILETTKILRYFSFISADHPDEPKEKAMTIAHALEHFRPSDKTRVVMVGDKEHDIIGANQNSIDSIGVLYGYGKKADIETAGATYIVKDADDLSALLLA